MQYRSSQHIIDCKYQNKVSLQSNSISILHSHDSSQVFLIGHCSLYSYRYWILVYWYWKCIKSSVFFIVFLGLGFLIPNVWVECILLDVSWIIGAFMVNRVCKPGYLSVHSLLSNLNNKFYSPYSLFLPLFLLLLGQFICVLIAWLWLGK